MAVNLVKPTVGGDVGTWGQELNDALDALAAYDDVVQANAAGDATTKANAARAAAEATAATLDAALDGRLDTVETALPVLDGRVDVVEADVLELQAASGTSDASALTTGTLAEARLPATVVLSGDVDQIVQTTQAAYDALGTKDARTLYVIV